MKIKEIIELSARISDNEKVCDYLTKGASEYDDQGAEKETELYLRCLNIVISELAVDYSAFRIKEKISTESGIIEYSSLSENAIEIISVVDEYGNKLAYKLTPTYLKTTPNTVTIEYTYIPKSFKLDGEVELSNKKVTLSLMASGVAGEYVLVSGDYAKGMALIEKYHERLSKLFIGKGGILKERSFL